MITSGAGIVTRMGSLSEGYYIGFNTDELYILRVIGDKEVRLISNKISSVRLNVRNSLKVTVKGSILIIYLNDTTREISLRNTHKAVAMTVSPIKSSHFENSKLLVMMVLPTSYLPAKLGIITMRFFDPIRVKYKDSLS